MHKTSTLFHTTILVLILAPGLFANAHFVLAQANGTGTTAGPSGVTPGQASDLVLDLGHQDVAEITGHLSLPDNATIVGAAVTVIPGPGAASPAARDDAGPVHPDGPRVDVGADGTDEWAFDGVGYGEAGHQTTFGNGVGEVQFGPGANTDHSWTINNNHANDTIRLPRGARVGPASLLLQPILRKDWWNSSWQRRVPIDIEATGDDILPLRMEHEMDLDGNYRNPVPELRLTMVEKGTEVLHPFWVVTSSWSRTTVGFEVPRTSAGSTRRFYLYYDNPFKPTSVAKPYVPVPLATMFDGAPVPTKLGATGGLLALKNPVGLCQASNGSLLVADMGNSRVVMLDTLGELQMTIGVSGKPSTEDGRFTVPFDVATDGAGHIAVVDPMQDRVQVFGPDGTYERAIGVNGDLGSDGAHLNNPWSVAFDNEGRIYVSDTGNERVQVFDGVGSTTAKWTYGTTGQYARDSSHLDAPRGIAVSGGLYVADAYNARVQHFAKLGDRYADRTLGINRLVTPTDVAVMDGRTYIADTDSGSVLELDSDGYYMKEMSGLAWPGGLAVGPWGDLWISETAASRIIRVVNATLTVGGAETLDAPRDLEVRLEGLTLVRLDGLITGPVRADGLGNRFMDAIDRSRCALDGFGNDMCTLRLSVSGLAPMPDAKIQINNLDIQYSFSTRVSVTLAPGTFMDDGGTRYLPVKASSRNGGCIMLEGFAPELDRTPFPLLSGVAPRVPEGTNGSKVLDLDEAFTDEGPLAFEVGIMDGPEGAMVWIEGHDIMVDLSISPNSTKGLDIWVSATDLLGQATTAFFNVIVDDVPDPPLVLEGQSFSAQCSRPFSGNISAEDGDGTPLLFYLLDGPEGLSLGPDGALDWTPLPAQAGASTIGFVVTDGMFDVDGEVLIEVGCVDHPPTVSVDGELTAQAGHLLVAPLALDDQDGDPLTVELRAGPEGMRYDGSRKAILWTPGPEDAGDHLVILSVSDGKLRILKALHVKVLGPKPWVRLGLAPALDGEFMRFSGKAGGTGGPIQKVMVRVDEGPWVNAEGTAHWSTDVYMAGLAPGIHRIEARSFDGSFSDVAGASFDVRARTEGDGGPVIALWPNGMYIAVLILVIVVIGGVVVLKTHSGFVFSVQKGPDGPTMCVPVGTRAETAGGKCGGEDVAEDVPDQPSRNIRCYVCLGRLKSAEDYLECKNCGRVYHKACASRIKACAICGADLVKEDS
jgi:hypothetical protein